MSVTICKYNHLLGVVVSGIMLFLPMSASAKCGGVDYSWGADALANAHDYTVTMMLYVVYLSYAIAGLVAVIGALQIYIKMQTGEGDITKSIMMLIGAEARRTAQHRGSAPQQARSVQLTKRLSHTFEKKQHKIRYD